MPPSSSLSWRPPSIRRRVAALAALALVPGLVAAAGASPQAAADPEPPSETTAIAVQHGEAGEPTSVVEVILDDAAEMDRLIATGVDATHAVEPRGDGVVVPVVVTASEAQALRAAGFELGETLYSPDDDAERALAERQRTLAPARRANRSFAARVDDPTAPDVSDVRIIRADYYTNYGTPYLSVEAKWADGATSNAPLTVERDSGPGTELGSGGTQVIQRFVDAGVYLYHRGATDPTSNPVTVRPDRVRITSPSGDVAIAEVKDWLPTSGDDPFKGPGYQEDFITSYLDPTQLYDRISQLAEQFPDRAELVELPFASNGYRRKAQALLDPPGNRVVAGGSEYAFVASTSAGSQVPTTGTPASGTAPVVVVDAAPAPGFPNATPSQGCAPLQGFGSGAIALVDRGECTFADKASNAQAAGASAVIVANNLAGAAQGPGNLPAGVTIPVVGVSQPHGVALRAEGTAARLVRGAAVANNARIGVDTLAWGHEGGNDVSVRLSRPSEPSGTIAVRVAGRSVEVDLATDAQGVPTSTAAQVVSAIDAHPAASQLVDAYTYRGSTGDGVVAPTRIIGLSDNLNAPDYVSHDPQPVYALRIGTAPEGEKPGVLAYAQEHAREWVPPLVTIETAERLLRNYGSHAPTTDLVDNLETWIVPSVNPDGGHYSFYDFASQRRNLVRYCEPNGNFDVNARNAWGVDLNRNHEEYSRFDGYDGASASCTSDVFSGPSEHSEGEARNIEWLGAKQNMKFSMNLHSSGNYFMWSPGSYRATGRVTAPRPSLRDEQFFEEASERILSGIKRHRGTTVTPARTGVTADVLYSAAGNSGDQLFYKHGLYAWNFETGVQFQPPFTNPDPTGASAQAESMEFANGLVEMLRVARDLDEDTLAPSTTVSVAEAGAAGQVNVTFDASEAVEIRYTLDGTRPTAQNGETLQTNGIREGAQMLLVDEGSPIFWYATDTAGNVEAGYDPADEGDTGFRKWRAEVGWGPTPSESQVALDLGGLRADGTAPFTATVSGDNEFDLTPSGTVTVRAGAAEPVVVRLSDGVATGRIGPFGAGASVTVRATYSGDDVNQAAVSRQVAMRAPKAASSVRVLRQSPNPARTNGPASRTRARLVVQVASPGRQANGQVRVVRAGEVVARGWLSQGRVTLRLPRFPVAGVKPVRVLYAGTAAIAPSATTYRVRVRR